MTPKRLGSSGKRAHYQKTKSLSVLDRREAVSRMYLTGKTQVEIAREFGVTQKTISQDLKEVRELWTQSAVMDFNERKAVELARIDAVEATAWEEFVKSQALEYVRTRRVTKARRPSDEDDAAEGNALEARLTAAPSTKRLTKKELEKKRELEIKMNRHKTKGEMIAIQEIRERIVKGKGVGDPAWIAIIQRCIDQRCQITGVNKPPEVNVNNNLTLVAWNTLHEPREEGDPVEDRIREAETLAIKQGDQLP